MPADGDYWGKVQQCPTAATRCAPLVPELFLTANPVSTQLNPGHAFGWNWTRDGEDLASIFIRSGTGQVILSYLHHGGSANWQRMG
jgi:hypothetical protein